MKEEVKSKNKKIDNVVGGTKIQVEMTIEATTLLIVEVAPFIGDIEHVPPFMVDNEFINHGYRIGFNSTKKILRSLFILHNESVNVWSHLFGVLLFIILIFYTFVSKEPPSLDNNMNTNMSNLAYAPGWYDDLTSKDRDQALLGTLINTVDNNSDPNYSFEKNVLNLAIHAP